MAVDEAMLAFVRRGADQILLRFYGWSPWCLSLGKNQAAPARLLGKERDTLRRGVDVVRRPTGGRAVFHGPEVTYALACPERMLGGPRGTCDTIHQALKRGLASLGVTVDPRPAGGPTGPHGLSMRACFRDPAPTELTVAGRKLVGSAQCRARPALLQHGSILLEDHQGVADLDRPRDTISERDPASGGPLRASAVGLSDLLSPPPPLPDIVDHLRGAVVAEMEARGASVQLLGDDSFLKEEARSIQAKHRSRAWLWRR